MIDRFIAQLAVFALRHKRLSGEQKAFVTSALLANLGAVPIKDILSTDTEGTLLVNNKKLSIEQAIFFKESLAGMQNSYARKLIREQLAFMAINIGVHNGLTQDGIIFSKAALWVIQEEEKLIKKYSGELSTG